MASEWRTGPARGDLKHWRYETLDIAPQLQAGKNVLAAVVWNYAEVAPMAQMMNETGFVAAGRRRGGSGGEHRCILESLQGRRRAGD